MKRQGGQDIIEFAVMFPLFFFMHHSDCSFWHLFQ